MRGPQAAGVLLGDPALIRAAWFQAAPHHNYGRGYKVGKEEIMGCWPRCASGTSGTHAAEWKEWQSWLDTIANRVKGLPSVTTEILSRRIFPTAARSCACTGCECAEDYRHGVRSEIGCGHASHHDRQRHRHQA